MKCVYLRRVNFSTSGVRIVIARMAHQPTAEPYNSFLQTILIANFRIAENNRPMRLIQTYKTCSRNALISCDWIFRRRGSASGSDLGRSTSVAEPHRLRFSLSHFLGRRTSLKLSGRGTATRSCGDALYVN